MLLAGEDGDMPSRVQFLRGRGKVRAATTTNSIATP
jgi:hypothetical protein